MTIRVKWQQDKDEVKAMKENGWIIMLQDDITKAEVDEWFATIHVEGVSFE